MTFANSANGYFEPPPCPECGQPIEVIKAEDNPRTLAWRTITALPCGHDLTQDQVRKILATLRE